MEGTITTSNILLSTIILPLIIFFPKGGYVIGNFLKKLKDEGWTQNEIAAETGLKQSYISQLRNDKAIPSLAAIIAIADAFGATLDEVIGRTPPEPKTRTIRKRNGGGENHPRVT